MSPDTDFQPFPASAPEQAALCLPVFNAALGRFERICTRLAEFPVYMLQGGLDAFIRALVVQHWQKPVDWSIVDAEFDLRRDADRALNDDELDIVQKRFVMWMKGGPDRSQVFELS